MSRTIVGAIGLVSLAMALGACTPLIASSTPEPTPNIEATVEAALASAVAPVDPELDVEATIEAWVEATLTAIPVPVPAPTPVIVEPTVVSMPTVIPLPTATPLPTMMPMPTETPLPSPTPEPTATPAPPPTPLPTPSLTERSNLRPRPLWTEDNPATLEELHEELRQHRGKSLVFASWGGAYQAAQRRAYLMLFQERFSINIVEEAPMSYDTVSRMVQTGSINWHVVDLGTRALWTQIRMGNLEELDLSAVDNRNHVESAKSRYGGGGGITYSTVLAYDRQRYGGRIAGWEAFFDRVNYPGTRSSRDNYDASWFAALSALNPDWYEDEEARVRLGRPTDDDVEEALELWRTNPPDRFWTTGSDCPQGLVSGEFDMCTAWNSRVGDAQRAGAPIKVCWECGHLVSSSIFAVPRGLKQSNPDAFELAELFIAWTGHPQINARMSLFIEYGPVNLKSVPYLAPYSESPYYDWVWPKLPNSAFNIPYAVFEDEKYTSEKHAEWTRMWEEYMDGAGN